jgi:hypothetical protein
MSIAVTLFFIGGYFFWRAHTPKEWAAFMIILLIGVLVIAVLVTLVWIEDRASHKRASTRITIECSLGFESWIEVGNVCHGDPTDRILPRGGSHG